MTRAAKSAPKERPEASPADPPAPAAYPEKGDTHSAGHFAGGIPDAASVWLPLDALRPWEKNPRKNDGVPVERVAESIRHFGFIAPIVVWTSAGRMVAGHTRLKAMRALMAADPAFAAKGAPGPGLARVVFHEFADEHEADLFALADNKLGELAAWDDEALAGVLGNYSDEEAKLAGFNDEDIAAGAEPEVPGGNDDVPDVPEEAITQPGDLWVLGKHRLLCGDATKVDDVARLVDGATIDLVWTDPPYGVSYVGKTKDALEIQNDKLGDDDLERFIRAAFAHAVAVCRAGAIWFVAAPPGPQFLPFAIVLTELGIWRQTLTWLKDRFVLGHSDYHYRHEPLFYGWKPGAPHRKTPDRSQDSVWECPRPGRSEVHPTMKPVALVERALNNATVPGELVLDLFGGSGTTLMAAAATGRVAYLLELDPKYCDVIVERWEKASGKKATREPAGVAA